MSGEELITFEDSTAGTQHTRPRAEVPDEVAFAEVGGARIAVARVVRRSAGDHIILDCFDVSGTLVRTISARGGGP